MMTLKNPQKTIELDIRQHLPPCQIADFLPMCKLNINHLGYHFYYLNPSTTQKNYAHLPCKALHYVSPLAL